MANLFIISLVFIFNTFTNLNYLSYEDINSVNFVNHSNLIVNKVDIERLRFPFFFENSETLSLESELNYGINELETNEQSTSNIIFGVILLVILLVGIFYLWRYEPFNKQNKH